MRGKKTEKQKEKKLILSRHPKNGFGFSIRGGKEYGTRIYISGVNTYAKAYQKGLTVGDVIVKANRKLFHDLSHAEAVEYIRSQRQLHLVVISRGILPDRKIAFTEYQWIDCYGEACSPLRSSSQIEGNKMNNNMLHWRRDNIRKVNVVVGTDKKIGLLIRGGSEFGLGIFVAGIDENSVAERSGIMVGEQIIELNGIDFLNISQKDAAYLIQNSKMMTFLLKDVSKIPVSKIVHEHIQWIDKRDTRSLSAAGSSKKLQNTVFKPGIAGSQIQHQAAVGPTSYSFLEEKANHSLNQDEWLTLKYYIREYIHGDVTVNGFALSLMDLLDTDEKMQLLTEVRSIVKAHDLDTFDTIILGQEVEAIKIENQYSLQTLSDESSAEDIEKTALHKNELMHGKHSYENGNIEHENELYEKEEELEERLLFQSFDESVQEEVLKSLREEEAHQKEYSTKLISSPLKERAAPPQEHKKDSYGQYNSIEFIPENTHQSKMDFPEKSQLKKNMKNQYNNQFMSNHDIKDNGNNIADEIEEKSNRSSKSSEITAPNKETIISNDYRKKIKRQQRFDTDSDDVGKNRTNGHFYNENTENRTNEHFYNEKTENAYETIEKEERHANEKKYLEETIYKGYDYSDTPNYDRDTPNSKLEPFNHDNSSKPLKFASLKQRLEVNENFNPHFKSIENSTDDWSHDTDDRSPTSSKNPNDFYSYYQKNPSGPSLSDFQPRYYKSMNLFQDKTDFTNEKNSEILPIATNDSQTTYQSTHKSRGEKSNKYDIPSKNEMNSSPTFDVTSTLEGRYARFSVNDILRQDYLPNTRTDSGNLHFSLNETSSDEFESKNKKPQSFKLNIRNQYQYENSENYRNLKPISTQDSVINDRFKMYGKPIMSKSPRYDSSGTVSGSETDSYKKLVTLKNPLKKVSELNDRKGISIVESSFLNNDLEKLTDFDLRAKELPQSSSKVSGSKERNPSALSESKISKVGSFLKSNHNKIPNVVKKGSFLISDENFVTESIVSKIEAFSDRNTQKFSDRNAQKAFSDRNTQKLEQTKLTKKGNQKRYKTKNVLIPNEAEDPGFTVSTKQNEKDIFISSIENKNLKNISVGDVITAIDDKPIAIGMKIGLVKLMIKNAFKSSNPNIKLTIKC